MTQKIINRLKTMEFLQQCVKPNEIQIPTRKSQIPTVKENNSNSDENYLMTVTMLIAFINTLC